MLIVRCPILGLALLLATIGDSSGQSQSEAPRQNTGSSQQQPNTKQRGTERAPSVIKILPAEQAQQKGTDDQQKGPDKPSDAWTLSDKIAAIASIVALLQFCALVATVVVLMRTASRQLRAYVFVADAEITDIGTDSIQAVVTIKNTGQTPAYDVTLSTKAVAFNIPGKVIFEPTPVGPDSSRFVFGPDATGRRNIPLHTILGEPSAIAALRERRGVLYVYGEILYKDAFKKDRYMRFRHMIGGSSGWPSDNKMTVCPEGNKAD